uniref:Uncharacterized protein n=1 Tax=Erpetoichthys calabaricus TaxID=27687 RepID=A0A8C4TEX5_ERPCA
MERMTMGILIIQKEGDELFSSLADVGIIIEGVEVMNELSLVASACAILFGLIYTLNLKNVECNVHSVIRVFGFQF